MVFFWGGVSPSKFGEPLEIHILVYLRGEFLPVGKDNTRVSSGRQTVPSYLSAFLFSVFSSDMFTLIF